MSEYTVKVADYQTLTTPCETFDFKNPPFDPTEFAVDLIRTMYEYNGIGLAANQVGVNYRIFAMRGSPENFVLYNPKIVGYSDELIKLEEGCLSFPGVIVNVERPRHIRTRFQTPNGEVLTKTFTGMTARVFQHEMDHISGILFYNRVSRLERDRAFKKAKKNGLFVQEGGTFIDRICDSVEHTLPAS
jgi:peptide deformylase